MEDYIISQDLLKEMQQAGLIDQVNEDIEPEPQPLPRNAILSDTKEIINTQINNKKYINNAQSSLIPEVSESQENAESFSFNYNSSSLGNINNKKEKKYFKQLKSQNENFIKEEENEEENNEKQIYNKDKKYDEFNHYNEDYNNDEEDIEIEKNIEKDEPNMSQSSFTSFGRPKTELVNTSLSTVGIEPLYCNTNHNFNLTPINQNRKHSNFDYNNHFSKNLSYKYSSTKNNKLNKRQSNGKKIKEIQKLQYELNSLSKQFEKIDKNLKNKNEELKKIKVINDSLLKENNNQKKIIESLNNEKVILNSKIISLKDYCNKMETKLISGSKNQHIIEINNKLRKENESLINELNFKENEKKDLINQNDNLIKEINILKKEFQSSLEYNNNSAELNSNNKISKIISELTQEKNKNILFEEEINKLKDDNTKKDLILQKMEEEIQSLNYGKTQMTTIIAHKENEIHNLTIERDSFQQHFQECNNQLRSLKEKIKDYDKIKKDKKEYEEAFLSLSNKQGDKNQKLTEQYETIIKKYLNEINNLKTENKELNNKLNEYEIEKDSHIKEYNLVINDKNKYNELFDKLVDKLNEDVNESINKSNERKEKENEIYNKLNYEKEKNLKLINEMEMLIN